MLVSPKGGEREFKEGHMKGMGVLKEEKLLNVTTMLGSQDIRVSN